MNKTILIVLILLLAGSGLLYFTDFQFLTEQADNNIPPLKKIPFQNNGVALDLDFFTINGDFDISVFAEGLNNPRVVVFDSQGRLLVSETKAGRVVVLEDGDNDGIAERKTVVLDNLKQPHGLAFYTDPETKIVYFYVAETHQVARYPYDVKTGTVTDKSGRNIATLPEGGRHFTRTIAFGPNYRSGQIIGGQGGVNTQVDTKLYISVGSSCDVCVEDNWKRAAILESDPEGNFTAEFAGGLRNPVFFTFHPETNEIWATETGRDNLGDTLPPDEINIVRVAGPEHQYGARRYGWPFCYGNQVRDAQFNPVDVARKDIPTDCSRTEPAVIELPARSTPFGLAFVPAPVSSGEAVWPPAWRSDLLVAYHGSGDRNNQAGYKIVKFKVGAEGNVAGVEDFISGWLGDRGGVYGNPADLKFGPDGALYISDDAAGIIYRVVPR